MDVLGESGEGRDPRPTFFLLFVLLILDVDVSGSWTGRVRLDRTTKRQGGSSAPTLLWIFIPSLSVPVYLSTYI